MGFSESQVDSAFAALGLGSPSPAEVTAIEAINGPIVWVDYSESNQVIEFPAAPAAVVIAELPEVQTLVAPVVQMFEAALSHGPTAATLAAMVQSNLSEAQLASAIVSSQAFANINNNGTPLDPNAPMSDGLVEALFIRDLGHAPAEATLAGFDGLTNAQAFLVFASSDTVSQALATNVQASIIQVITLATGLIGIDPLPADTVGIVGQSSSTHIGGAQVFHTA
jgi:hypothetical protein